MKVNSNNNTVHNKFMKKIKIILQIIYSKKMKNGEQFSFNKEDFLNYRKCLKNIVKTTKNN